MLMFNSPPELAVTLHCYSRSKWGDVWQCSLYNSCLQQESPRQLKPTPKHSLTSLIPFVSLSSVFSHLLLQAFQDLAVLLGLFNAILFCFTFTWEFREACMESSFQNVLTLGCSQVQRRHVCIWNSSVKLNSSYSDLNLAFNELYPLCGLLETWMWFYPISHLGEVSQWLWESYFEQVEECRMRKGWLVIWIWFQQGVNSTPNHRNFVKTECQNTPSNVMLVAEK